MMSQSWGQVVLVLVLTLRTCGSVPAPLPTGGGGGNRTWAPEGEGGGCGPCDPDLCPGTRVCRAGPVPDSCDCCQECGNLEGQTCDPGTRVPGARVYGRCGTGLRCEREGPEEGEEPREGEGPEEPGGRGHVCVCEDQDLVCGSDGKTYRNKCHFKETDQRTETWRRGPCLTVPVIKVPPRGRVLGTGSSLNFLCEVFAFPMAQVDWTKDGQEVLLPGDDPHLSVQSRGGPLKFELSSWLQIEGAEPGDSGTYRCLARNSLGSVTASAQLGILSAEDLSSYLANSTPQVDTLDYDQDS